jgi:hypothetical protein
MAELNNGIAIVGVLPGELICKEPNCGSAVATTPGQAPKLPVPLLVIRLPALSLVRVTDPNVPHSFAPLFVKIVLASPNVAELSLYTATPPPAYGNPLLLFELIVHSFTINVPSREKIAAPALLPLLAAYPPRPGVT